LLLPSIISCLSYSSLFISLFFSHAPSPTLLSTLSLHDALPISSRGGNSPDGRKVRGTIHWVSAEDSFRATVHLYDRLFNVENPRSEEHTSELQSRFDLVCRLLLEKKKEKTNQPRSARQTRYDTR